MRSRWMRCWSDRKCSPALKCEASVLGVARTLEQLLGKTHDFRHVELDAAIEQAAKVVVHVLEDQIHAAPLPKVLVACISE